MQETADTSSPEMVHLFGIFLHRIRMKEAIALLQRWMTESLPCRYVFTPNVDHIVKIQSSPAMQAAYREASLVVADGWPLVAASRWLRQPLPERVAGSDLVPALLAGGDAIPGFRVFLLGGAPGVAERASERIRSRWPATRVVGIASPEPGFENNPEALENLVAAINAAKPHLLVIGLGAPKQEIWLQNYARLLQVPVAIGAGATIDFLAGEQTRAPRWVQRLRLEWLFRLASDPKRLAGRYLHDAIVFPRLVAAERRRLRSKAGQSR